MTYEELFKINETYKKRMLLRHPNINNKYDDNLKHEIVICGGTGCMSSNSLSIKEEFEKYINEYQLSNECHVYMSGCFGLCQKGPVVVVFPEETFYAHMKKEYVKEIVEEHIINGNIVKKYAYKEKNEKGKLEVKSFNEMTFYKKQKRIALRNCGFIDPYDINEYIGSDGYLALAKCLREYKSGDVINIIKDSMLRGRGGGGFPTGLKWEYASKNESPKYVICNADEGDPGAFMDRAILEGDPFCIVEALTIAGYAILANEGFIYVRSEYPLAVIRLQKAIEKAYSVGLLGENILNSGFKFDLEVRLGAGAFVCGEETALIKSIEGDRGMPKNKPPFPANDGLWHRPTVINNVETLANVPIIINKGADWFKQIGTIKSKGTKVFALGGKINNTGLLEVPMGTTLKEVIYDIGGGIPNNKEFKAVQTGGPSGGCLTKNDLDTKIDYDNLIEKGSMMGSGGMIVMDEDNCMVDVAKFYLDFTVDESCGKCSPCREGTKRLKEILDKITKGDGELEDLNILSDLAYKIKDSALCGLGQTAPNPVLSTLHNFKDEYLAHINKTCPAGVCKNLTRFYITDDCIGCSKCARNCPTKAITGNFKEKHVIDQSKCIKCGTCRKGCPKNAIICK